MNLQNKAYYGIELLHQTEEYWRKIVEYAFFEADIVEFSVSGKNSAYPEKLESFSSLLIRKFSSKWKWFSKQLGYTTLFQFKLNQDLFDYICSISHLDAWTGKFPEDPTFYRDTVPIVWTISHDGVAMMLLSENEVSQFREYGLDLKLMTPPSHTDLHGDVT